MADIKSSLGIQSLTDSNSVKVSKDLNDNAVGNAIWTQLSDGTAAVGVTSNALDVNVTNTSVTVTATDLDIRPLQAGDAATEDNILVFSNTVKDGSGTNYVPLVDTDGHLQVDILSGAGGSSIVDDAAFTLGTSTITPVGGIYVSGGDNVDDGDAGALRMTQDRILFTQPFDGTNEMPMMDAVARAGFQQITDGTETLNITAAGEAEVSLTTELPAGTQNIGDVDVASIAAGSNLIGKVTINDGTEDWSIDASGYGQVDIANVSVTAVPISKDGSANAETNPLFVQVVDGAVSGLEVLDYDTASAVAAAGSSNHDYTVTATKTLKVRRAFGSASGCQKIEIQSGPVASLTTKAVLFTTGASLNWEAVFEGLLEVPDTSTGTVRIIRTNREAVAMDVYSTIEGTEV